MTELYREEKMLPTVDDWYPCFPRSTVRCSLLTLRDGKSRVAVWGADDSGMERDFDLFEDAEKMYKRLPNPVERAWLTDQGFRRG